MAVKCDLCAKRICKYSLDFNSTDAVAIWIGREQAGDERFICNECAKKIVLEMIEK